MKREEHRLAEEAFVFCCLNVTNKIAPKVFSVWCRSLLRVPENVLWLSSENTTIVENIRKEAEKRSVDPKRIFFATKLPHEEYLARYQLEDLF